SDLFADALADLPADAPAQRESLAPRAEPSFERARPTPPPVPPDAPAVVPEASPAPQPAPDAPAAPAARRSRLPVVAGILVLLAANAGVVGGLVQTRREARRAVAPIAAVAADVQAVKEEQLQSQAKLAETRAELAETRRDVAKQAATLRGTVETLDATVARQKSADRELKDLATRQAQDVATLAQKMRLAERRSADGSFAVTLGEAAQLLDATEGAARRAPTGKIEPQVRRPDEAEKKTPAPAPAVDW
ncbi:MAG TPA: hypothetical protein VLT33_37165, partial [Labilithrix sp.]|nr:hypothetical protein [Labilithrix sp.]